MKTYKFRAYHRSIGRMFYSDSHKDAEFWNAKVGDSVFEVFVHTFSSLFIDNKDGLLMQFTGLLDKQGKEIYEGDILLSSSGNLLCLVTFEDGKFGWDIRYKNPEPNQRQDCFGRSYGSQNEADKIEVIGNIYSNKELLK